MKHLVLFLCCLVGLASSALAQLDTTGGQLIGAGSGPAVLEMRDALGRLLSRQPVPLGPAPMRLPLPALATRLAGTYHLLLRAVDGTVQRARLLTR